MIAEAIMLWLKAESTITALVGSRIYFVEAPQLTAQGTDPYIVFNQVGIDFDYTHGGGASVAHARYQFNIMGKTFAEVKGISQAILALFLPYNKPTVQKMGNKVWVQTIDVENEMDGKDDVTGSYFVVVDAVFNYVL